MNALLCKHGSLKSNYCMMCDMEKQIKELKEELIDAYLNRGHMYSAGEKEWIDNRIEELKN